MATWAPWARSGSDGDASAVAEVVAVAAEADRYSEGFGMEISLLIERWRVKRGVP